MSKYTRQTILKEIGPLGQEALARSTMLVVGAGGLGSPALLYLAAAGVGKLVVIDDDRVDESNLQRQILFKAADEGESKAILARKHLLELNPEIQIEAINGRFSAANAATLVAGVDVVIDGSDNFETKYLVNDAAVKFSKPVVHGSISGFEGQVSVFDSTRGPCHRCLHPEPPKTPIRNCAEAGVMGALAGIIGSMQAMEAIKIVVSRARPESELKPLYGELAVVNCAAGSMDKFKFPKNDSCAVCSVPRESIVLQDSPDACDAFLDKAAVREILAKKGGMLIDVRETEERLEWKIDGSVPFSLSKLLDGHLPDVARDQKIVIHCATGVRAATAISILRAAGFSDLSKARDL